jgi:hypothetical protein
MVQRIASAQAYKNSDPKAGSSRPASHPNVSLAVKATGAGIVHYNQSYRGI